MEQSDSMLISSLKDFISIPEHIQTLRDIRAEQVFTISIKLLEFLKVDTGEVKVLSSKAQKFRSMAKLNQSLLKELQTQFQLNQLMNPSVPFLRKFLLVVINKLGSVQGQDKGKGASQPAIKVRETKKQLKNWLSQEWIHPALAVKKQKYKGYVLPLTINKNFLKNNLNLTAQLNNPQLSNNVQAIMCCTLSKHNQRVQQFQANEGISRKQNEEAAIRLNNIIKINKDDWNIASNKLNKIKKKIAETGKESSEIISPPIVMSVYKQQLEQVQVEAEKKKQSDQVKFQAKTQSQVLQDTTSLNPLQLLRHQAQKRKLQYETEIKNILQQLSERKEHIEKWEQQKENLEQKITTDEQKAVKIKQQTVELKKKVQKRQVILSTLQGESNIQQDVKKLEGQINALQSQAKTQVGTLQKQIKSLQIESKQKMDALNQLKTKLNKIQKEYQEICEQITQKQELKSNVKIMKSGISRLYYHKKISEIESRWRETDKETKKMRESLKQLRQKTRVSGTLNQRVETEIENILNMDKSKNEPQNRTLKELMTKCRETFQITLKTLEDINNVKIQTQDYEMKVHSLSGKNYKQNIQKIGLAMEQLKRQVSEQSKSKTK